MKKGSKIRLGLALFFLIAFAVWTVLVCFVDLQPIGPMESTVGFATLNGAFHRMTGVHLSLYNITDLLSVLPLAAVAAFGVLGLVQWIKRKSFLKVDRSILILGGFYIVVLALFGLFEVVEINYRPILIEGVLEASYPSSTTMLAMCVIPTAMMQLGERIKIKPLRLILLILIGAFGAFMVVGRLISGVHWLTDILGGALLSTGLIFMYAFFTSLEKK